jgi:hypothetical protein
VNGDLATLTKLVTQFNETNFDVEAAGKFNLTLSIPSFIEADLESCIVTDVIIAPPALYIIPLLEHVKKVKSKTLLPSLANNVGLNSILTC